MKIKIGTQVSYETTIDTHMGILPAVITLEQIDETFSQGKISFMGKDVPFDSCAYEPDVYFIDFPAFNLSVRMFVSVNEDGSILGAATAPHHQVMQVTGKEK